MSWSALKFDAPSSDPPRKQYSSEPRLNDPQSSEHSSAPRLNNPQSCEHSSAPLQYPQPFRSLFTTPRSAHPTGLCCEGCRTFLSALNHRFVMIINNKYHMPYINYFHATRPSMPCSMTARTTTRHDGPAQTIFLCCLAWTGPAEKTVCRTWLIG